jgi:uncharacterized protein YkwD
MWKNRIIVILTITLLVCYNTNGQNKWKLSDYSKLTINNFRENKLFQETIDFNNIDFARLNAAIFYVTNEVRDKKRLPVLEYSPYLEKSATIHSEDMVKYNFFNHINPKNKKHRDPNDRGTVAGITNPLIAENIIEGYGLVYIAGKSVYKRGPGKFSYTPEGPLIESHTYLSFADEVVDKWMHSKGHRANILSKNNLQLGCGTAFFINGKFNEMPTFMATQNFQQYKKIETK